MKARRAVLESSWSAGSLWCFRESGCQSAYSKGMLHEFAQENPPTIPTPLPGKITNMHRQILCDSLHAPDVSTLFINPVKPPPHASSKQRRDFFRVGSEEFTHDCVLIERAGCRVGKELDVGDDGFHRGFPGGQGWEVGQAG